MHASTSAASRYKQPALVLAMASTAFLFGGVHRAAGQNRSASDIEEEARDRVLQERLRQAENLRTRQVVEQFAAYVEDAAKLLAELEAKASSFQTRFDGLLTNDDGKRIARDDLAIKTYLRYRDDPIVSMGETVARKKAVDSLLAQLRTELKSQNVGYHPAESQRRDTDEHYFWARERLASVSVRSDWLDSVLFRAPKIADLQTAKSLQDVIRDYQLLSIDLLERARLKGEGAARQEAEPIVAEKTRVAELERLLTEANIEIERMKTETQQKLADAEIREKNLLAELDRAKKLADAERHSKNVDAELKSGQIVSEAEKKRLIAKCSDPEVRTILAPFLDKGYFRPSDNMHGSRRYDTLQPVPISFADLQKLGALNPTGTGADMLHKIASAPIDSMRTRWPGFRKKWQDDPGLREMVPKAQQLLNELGPTMVELGMLSP